MTEHFFAPCPRGLEQPLAVELEYLGASGIAAAEGGVGFAGSFELAYTANLESRLASRILWRVGGGRYRDERDVHAIAADCDWNALFAVGKRIRVDVAATGSPLQSLEYATLTVKDAVCDRFRADTGRRPSVDKAFPDVRVHVYLTAAHCTLYVDTSGEALFKRGYRRTAVAAPLRENLAAGLLALAGWDPAMPLLDPMCGSGTIVIEAAAMSLAIAPGLGRSFGFEALRRFDAALWRSLQQRARSRIRHRAAQPIVGSDIDRRAIDAARANASDAGVAGAIRFRIADATEIDPPAAAGFVVCNPPYGVRVDDRQRLADLYPRLGDALKQRFAGWTAYLFTADPALPRLIGLKPTRRMPLFNGALECRLFEFRLLAGSPGRLRSRAAESSRHAAPSPGGGHEAKRERGGVK